MQRWLMASVWAGLLSLTLFLLFLLARWILWKIRFARHGPEDLLSEGLRRAVLAVAVVYYLLLLACHIVWPERLLAFLVASAVVLIFFASQIFWLQRVNDVLERLVPVERQRNRFRAAGMLIYVFLFLYNLPLWERASEPVRLTVGAALLQAPFRLWFVSSVLGFVVVILFWAGNCTVRAVGWLVQVSRNGFQGSQTEKPIAELISLSRRRFLEKTAIAAAAAPFLGGVYGLFYGRLNLQVTRKRLGLHRLPNSFDGFSIVQLSDVHIGPFMPEEEIRKYVEMANQSRADLVVLTGDYVTWDSKTQGAVVDALSGLKAPFGVYGCLGNHEAWTDTQDSITHLFALRGIRILRQQNALVRVTGEVLNLIGVDFQSAPGPRPHGRPAVHRYLPGIEKLIVPETVNVLMSHNPNSFDRAAQFGIDLTLAGHTHGGQVTLEFIHPSLSPSRLITDYVRGWFRKRGSQLYVNRGIGTIGVPIRFGAPPEITVFELTRA